MKMFLISDNNDTKTGLRLAGIEGVVAHKREEVMSALTNALNDRDIGIILLTEKLMDLVYEEVMNIKLHRDYPLIVEIPDRHGTMRDTDKITKYIREAIGLKI
ncbi:V-type ATP synthase subunit F [Thermoclostridium stercorarium]|jgi:V/A-type H+-transporting ATPase subunit F|uniref:ATPase n=1 Tax=Thermoclostridium stercorarium subsp. leptospartum DSM 9219 TaxID=1346611 RepID=A0A1B1YND1_THEST|nr:V-type ATP synthase subunit F [Thermoclostridium stercorarium]ANX02290.1 ATPase [Thermoclostridium stercorarium subsp. leptospartum DSM 9219]UZQ85369.1 V-type ATP synthase subunit F [Thermoclostridium stercorarium]